MDVFSAIRLHFFSSKSDKIKFLASPILQRVILYDISINSCKIINGSAPFIYKSLTIFRASFNFPVSIKSNKL